MESIVLTSGRGCGMYIDNHISIYRKKLSPLNINSELGWFQIFVIFTPIQWEMISLTRTYFWNGLKPLARNSISIFQKDGSDRRNKMRGRTFTPKVQSVYRSPFSLSFQWANIPYCAIIDRKIKRRNTVKASREKPFNRGSGCREVRFCSFSCQRKSWKEHKRQCQGQSISNVTWLKMANVLRVFICEHWGEAITIDLKSLERVLFYFSIRCFPRLTFWTLFFIEHLHVGSQEWRQRPISKASDFLLEIGSPPCFPETFALFPEMFTRERSSGVRTFTPSFHWIGCCSHRIPPDVLCGRVLGIHTIWAEFFVLPKANVDPPNKIMMICRISLKKTWHLYKNFHVTFRIVLLLFFFHLLLSPSTTGKTSKVAFEDHERHDGWVVLFNTDAFPGHDAGAVTTGPEAAKEVCRMKGFEGKEPQLNWIWMRWLMSYEPPETIDMNKYVIII